MRTVCAGLLMVVAVLAPETGHAASADRREGPATILEREQSLRIERLVADRALVIVRERGIAYKQELRRLDEYQAKDRELLDALKQVGASAARLKEMRKAREKLAQERLRLTQELVGRSREFEIELAAYREAVTGIAQSPSPEKRAALQRYADGDRKGAYVVLDEIADAEDAARAKVAQKANAATSRQNCPLALEMKDRGEADTTKVIRCYEKVVGWDDGEPRDWFALVELYNESGALTKAQQASMNALAASKAKWRSSLESEEARRDLIGSYGNLGDVAIKSGDLAEARRWYELALPVSESLAKKNPTSSEAQRVLSASYRMLGHVAVAAGELAKARRRYEQSRQVSESLVKKKPSSGYARRELSYSYRNLGDVAVRAEDLSKARDWYEKALEIWEALAERNPTSAAVQRGLSDTYGCLGDVAIGIGHLTEARRRYEQTLKVRESLAKKNATSALAQRDLSVAFGKLGIVAEAVGDLADARHRYEQSLHVSELLRESEPKSAEVQRDLSVAYCKLGDLATAAEDLAEAGRRYEQAIEVRTALAKQNHASADAQRDLASSWWRLGVVTESSAAFQRAAAILARLKSEGHLTPADEKWFESLTARTRVPAGPVTPSGADTPKSKRSPESEGVPVTPTEGEQP